MSEEVGFVEKPQMSNSFLEDLLSFIDEAEVEEANFNEKEDGFCIESMDQANYIAKKLKELRKEKQEIEESAKNAMDKYAAKIQAWKEKNLGPYENQEEFFLRMLKSFAEEKLRGSTKKSIKLIEGTIGFKKQQDKYEYEDEQLLEFLESSHKEFVKYKPSVDKIKLKSETTPKEGKLYFGEVLIPGVTVTPQEEKFDLK